MTKDHLSKTQHGGVCAYDVFTFIYKYVVNFGQLSSSWRCHGGK
jgi:hypothetical protein